MLQHLLLHNDRQRFFENTVDVVPEDHDAHHGRVIPDQKTRVASLQSPCLILDEMVLHPHEATNTDPEQGKRPHPWHDHTHPASQPGHVDRPQHPGEDREAANAGETDTEREPGSNYQGETGSNLGTHRDLPSALYLVLPLRICRCQSAKVSTFVSCLDLLPLLFYIVI